MAIAVGAGVGLAEGKGISTRLSGCSDFTDGCAEAWGVGVLEGRAEGLRRALSCCSRSESALLGWALGKVLGGVLGLALGTGVA